MIGLQAACTAFERLADFGAAVRVALLEGLDRLESCTVFHLHASPSFLLIRAVQQARQRFFCSRTALHSSLSWPDITPMAVSGAVTCLCLLVRGEEYAALPWGKASIGTNCISFCCRRLGASVFNPCPSALLSHLDFTPLACLYSSCCNLSLCNSCRLSLSGCCKCNSSSACPRSEFGEPTIPELTP